jgi:hypothetical protein
MRLNIVGFSSDAFLFDGSEVFSVREASQVTASLGHMVGSELQTELK